MFSFLYCTICTYVPPSPSDMWDYPSKDHIAQIVTCFAVQLIVQCVSQVLHHTSCMSISTDLWSACKLSCHSVCRTQQSRNLYHRQKCCSLLLCTTCEHNVICQFTAYYNTQCNLGHVNLLPTANNAISSKDCTQHNAIYHLSLHAWAGNTSTQDNYVHSTLIESTPES